MKITRDLLRRWGACYTDAEIAPLVPEAGLTPMEIAALDIPEEDRLWVLLREDVVPARELRLLACDWAEAACRKSGWNDERSLEAIAVARRFAVGEATEAELAAAWTAAVLSARSDRSAWASEASASAAWLAASEAATRSAAWSEAAAAQLADVVKVLKQIDEAAKAGKGAE